MQHQNALEIKYFCRRKAQGFTSLDNYFDVFFIHTLINTQVTRMGEMCRA